MTELNPELIDKAARALWDEPGWEQASHEQRQHHREAAERALSAVADDLRAEGAVRALEDVADGLSGSGPDELTFTSAIVADIRARAITTALRSRP